MIHLVLASSSIYRKKQLQQLQLNFSVIAPFIDETPLANETPKQTALRLSIEKARSVGLQHSNTLVIGCDQVASFEGKPLGKPLSHENAVKQLRIMQGKEIIFHSGICLFNAVTGNIQSSVVDIQVKFRSLSDQQIENYLVREQPYDCAGSAKSEGLGVALLDYIRGDDPNALIGLPLIQLVTMLEKEGIKIV
ncbi:MAG: septum formation inhibitor Maf [Methylophilaceae bacterium]|jgi:septum formation protein|nr:septum formation inhibitor Maf [Methylophilaceae bacterium]